MGENRKILWVSLLLAVLFAGGLMKLFFLRFQSGDIYPVYSSMRSDPLGSRVLYESFAAMPDITVSRHHRPLNHLHLEKENTVFFLDMPQYFPSAFIKEFTFLTTRLSQIGGKLVISFTPENIRTSHKSGAGDEDTPEGKCDDQAETPEGDPESSGTYPQEDADDADDAGPEKAWMNLLGIDIAETDHGKPSGSAILNNGEATGLPETLTWRSDVYFTRLSDAWRVVYTQDEQPVIVKRSYGKGTIILCADTYLFSNEAMLRHRKTGALAWMMGKPGKIIFDEFHLGISEKPGIVALARKYKLDALIVVGVLLSILVLWKNAIPFVPHQTGADFESAKCASGSTIESLVRLMKSNIDRKSLLPVCLTQWEKTSARDRRITPEMIESVRKIVETVSPDAKDPGELIDAYKRICQFVSRKNRRL